MPSERPPAQAATPSHREANYVLAVLFVVIMLNFLDRQVISIVAEPIKQEMGLTDKQIGLMTGLSFALFYTTLAIPVALLADKWHRSRIIAVAIGIWSVMTMLCGSQAILYNSFWRALVLALVSPHPDQPHTP